jgi:hypothetical protein
VTDTSASPGEVPPPPRRRRRPDPLIVVLAVMAVGFLLTWLHHPRMGMYVVAAAVGAAAVLRAVLPARDAGLLVVRSRTQDVVVLAVLTVALAVLAGVTPFPAPGA